MTSKLVVNTIEADTGISSVSFASSISLSSTSIFHISNSGINIGADTNINRPSAGVIGFNINGSEAARINANGFSGDGSQLTGLPAGLGTALSTVQTSPLNKLYYTDRILSIGSTVTVDHPASATGAYTQYADILVEDNADLIVADGDDLIPDILGLGGNGTTGAGGAGRLLVDNIVNRSGTGAPSFPNGAVVTGVVTATSFVGNGANLTGISADYVKLAQASGASGGSELIFDNLDVSTYKFFDLVAFLRPATDAQQLRFYYREGGASGSNITGNSYAYGFNEKKESNTSNCTAGSPDTYMRITGSIGNHASEGVGVNMRISVAQSGDNATAKWLANFVSWNAVYREQGNAARMTNGQGHLYDDTKYPTGFSFHFENGNINNYSYTLYGLIG